MLRPHDLLWIDGPAALSGEQVLPGWVSDSLSNLPVVVVRRTGWVEDLVPVGVRGATREQRFAAAVPLSGIRRAVSPEDLVGGNRHEPSPRRLTVVPALRDFGRLTAIWADLPFAWGPAGSVGFELATGVPVASATSDLDLVLRAPEPLSRPAARALLAALDRLDAPADVQMETPVGCVSLAEYGASTRRLLLRTIEGPRLMFDPWDSARGEG